MAKPLRLPGVEEQRVLDGLEVHLLLERDQQERWNQHIIEGHYLHRATLVGEQLRYAVSYSGQWLALLGWSAPAWHLRPRDHIPTSIAPGSPRTDGGPVRVAVSHSA